MKKSNVMRGGAAVSKNFNNQPGAANSINFNFGGGSPSIMQYSPPANTPNSCSFAPAGPEKISKNFIASDAAARAASRKPGGQTHSVMRRGWGK